MILLEMSVSASLLIIAITFVRVLAIDHLPKATFVILWGIVICRLLLPFSISSPFGMGAGSNKWNNFLTEGSATTVVALPQATTIKQMINPAGLAAAATPIPADLDLIIWGLGSVACASFFLAAHIRSRREYETALPIDKPFVAEWLRSHKTIRPVRIRQFDQISAPLTYGVFHPVILLPKGMDWSDEEQIQYVLAHEFTHIQRFDTAWKWLLAVSLWIHWFNPLVWGMYVLANRDMELSCDEAVVRTFGATQRSAYARALIKLEERRSKYSFLYNNFSKDAIKERIHAIMKLKRITLAGMSAAALLVIVALIIFATTGPMRIRLSTLGNGNVIASAPVSQAASAVLAGVTTMPNGNRLAQPAAANPLSAAYLAGLSADAKGISDAKDLIQSTAPANQSKAGPFSGIVIKFKQAMDVSTLDYPNIIVMDQHSTVVDYMFNFNYDEKTQVLHLDMKPDFTQNERSGVGTRNTIQVFLTNKIKTADGKYIDADYVFSYRT
jgi:beta-lactamase regulating signal transducer with metallopeptidase domain